MTDEFRRRADECRRLAAASSDASGWAFWLGLMERFASARKVVRSAASAARAQASTTSRVAPEPATSGTNPLRAMIERSDEGEPIGPGGYAIPS